MSMTKRKTNEELLVIQNKMKDQVGKEMSYQELCRVLDQKPKSGNSKIAQIKEFELLCDLKKDGIYYTIERIYDKALLPISSKFQEFVSFLIISMLESKHNQSIYVTNTQLLECLYLVNENYRVLKNDKNRIALANSTGRDFEGFYEASETAGKILTKWVNRELNYMEGRGLIMVRPGFCAVEEIKIDKVTIKKVVNVELNSPLEKKLMDAFVFAAKELGINEYARWIPPKLKPRFYALADKKVYELTEHKYKGAYRVNVITGAPKSIKMELVEVKKALNTESKRKIGKTQQIKGMTDTERQQMIAEIIESPAPVRYKDYLDK